MMDPIGTAQLIYDIGKAIYDQVQLAQANQSQCQTLAKRVQIVTSTLKQMVDDIQREDVLAGKIDASQSSLRSQQFEAALTELQSCLTEGLTFVQQFSIKNNWFVQVLKAGTHDEAFATLNKRLEASIAQLNLGLSVQQVMDSKQDRVDRAQDYQAIQAQQEEIIRLNKGTQWQLHGMQWQQAEQQQIVLNQLESMRLQIAQLDINKPKAKPPIDPQLNVHYFDIAFDNIIKRGSFGTIYLGRWFEQPVAIKTLQGQLTESEQQQFIREVSIMSRLRCSTITQLYGACIEPERAFMLMEHLENGSLYDAIDKRKEGFTPEQQHRMALDIARGLYYLHSQSVLHRNLKSTNVLLNSDWHAKLTDFGLSKIYSASIQTSQERSQAIQWLAPETFGRNSMYTPECDIYSYGVILWEIFTCKRPYANIKEDLTSYLQAGYRETIPADVPAIYANIIQQCWAAKPTERPRLVDIIRQLQQYVLRPPSPKPEYIYEQGIQHEKKQAYSEAYTCYERAANKGYAKAKTNLSTFFLKGMGGAQQDKRHAYMLLLEAAQSGHPRAMHNVARMLEKGDGVAQDLTQALHWYQQGAKQGDIKSQNAYQRLTEQTNATPIYLQASTVPVL